MRATAISLIAVVLIQVNAYAHCGGKHTGNHPHCSSGGGGGGGNKPVGNPSFVYSTVTSNSVIRIMNDDGSDDQVLSHTLNSGGGVFGPPPSWAPTRDEIAWIDGKFRKPSGVVVRRLDGQAYAAGGSCAGQQLCLLFESTTTIRAGGGNADAIDWGLTSCDDGNLGSGRYIAFIGRGNLHPTDDDGVDSDLFLNDRDDPISVTNPVNVTNTPNEDLEGVAWSSDGQRLAVFAFDASDTSPNGWGDGGRIDIINVCSIGYSRDAFNLPANDPIQRVLSIDWVENGADQLLLAGTDGVWIVDFSGGTSIGNGLIISQIVGLTGSPNGDVQVYDPIAAVWSPDGNDIAVSFWNSDGSTAVSIIDWTAGSVSTQISGTNPGRLDWRQPD